MILILTPFTTEKVAHMENLCQRNVGTTFI